MKKGAKKVVPMAGVPAGAVLVGEGALSWCMYERVEDRYGTVNLWTGQHGNESVTLNVAHVPEHGYLAVEILEVRHSGHIGDWGHGFAPGGAVQGDVFALGAAGQVYVPRLSDRTATGGKYSAIGIRPSDGRGTFWLNPLALYRAHEQLVRLYAVPKKARARRAK